MSAEAYVLHAARFEVLARADEESGLKFLSSLNKYALRTSRGWGNFSCFLRYWMETPAV